MPNDAVEKTARGATPHNTAAELPACTQIPKPTIQAQKQLLSEFRPTKDGQLFAPETEREALQPLADNKSLKARAGDGIRRLLRPENAGALRGSRVDLTGGGKLGSHA